MYSVPLSPTEIIGAKFLAKHEAKKKDIPLHVFPQVIQDICEHYAGTCKYPIEYFACALFAAVSTAIGRKYILKFSGYEVIAAIWMIIVGMPGLNKSTPLVHGIAPITKKQKEYTEDYNRALGEEKDPNQPKPTQRKILISDSTSEKLIQIESENPEGSALVMDELGGWINNLNRYSGGGDLQLYLSLFNGGSITRDTLKSFSAFVEKTFLTIAGTIQPGIFYKLFQTKSDSGFPERFLICFPQDVVKSYPSKEFLDPAMMGKYEAIINKLLDETCLNVELEYTPQAYNIIDSWLRKAIDRENGTDNETERAIIAKMEIYVHRFALILEMLEFATSHNTAPNNIGTSAATGAVALADYFLSQAVSLRITDKSELLPANWKKVYNTLPDYEEFKTIDFVNCAWDLGGIKKRTAQLWIAANSKPTDETRLFSKTKTGFYVKN